MNLLLEQVRLQSGDTSVRVVRIEPSRPFASDQPPPYRLDEHPGETPVQWGVRVSDGRLRKTAAAG